MPALSVRMVEEWEPLEATALSMEPSETEPSAAELALASALSHELVYDLVPT